MADFNTIDDLDLDGKVVLTRVDVNVPVENGQVTDATRIGSFAPGAGLALHDSGEPVALPASLGYEHRPSA